MASQIYGIVEAEDFDVKKNMSVESANYASQGKLVVSSGSGTGTLQETITGVSGTYDLRLTYFDENDGASQTKIYVDDVLLDSWSWNKQLGSGNATSATQTTHTIRNVKIDSSAEIRIEGTANGKEHLKIDKLELLPAESRDTSPGLDAFPGAEGFGSDTPGGRGGWIVKVTNLNDSGVGSLRWALQDLDVPRIVVFDVGGEIKLKKQIHVMGDVTVAGQTAPGDGITISGARLHVVGNDVIIRGLHIRPGDGPGDAADLRDAISVGTAGTKVQNVVIDHNSFSWAVDENASVWEGASNVTFSNNIIAEGLNNSIHPEGAHSAGLFIADGSSKVTAVNNLITSNSIRSPQLYNASSVEIVNNLDYNYGNNAVNVSDATAHIIGNVFIQGQNSSNNSAVRIFGDSDAYVKDNLDHIRTSASQADSKIADSASQGMLSTSKVFASSNVSAIAASGVEAYVLANVGARTGGDLDPVDTRILNSVINDTGKIVNAPVGSYTPPSVTTTLADKDDDGIPDRYETTIGSDASVFDPHGDVDGDGYTNIEEYLNGLITGFSKGGASSGGGSAARTLIEAEDFTLVSGFKATSVTAASGKEAIQATASSSVARTTFSGKSGSHDLTLSYFDENDGVGHTRILVNGEVVAEWDWNDSLGSANANAKTLTSHTVSDVDLSNGDTIQVDGSYHGHEQLRIDMLLIG